MALPCILAKLLKQQAELAGIVAAVREIDEGHRQKLHNESLVNAAAFDRFLGEYQITVKKRKAPPSRKVGGKC